MPDVSFESLAVVMGVAFVAPLALGLVPRLRVPAVVLEIVLGIVIGPQVLALGVGGRAGADPLGRRAGVPALPRRARDRLRSAARTTPAARGARVPGLPGACGRRRCRARRARVRARPAARGGDPDRDVARTRDPGAQGGRSHRQPPRPAGDRRCVHRGLLRGDPPVAAVLEGLVRHRRRSSCCSASSSSRSVS